MKKNLYFLLFVILHSTLSAQDATVSSDGLLRITTALTKSDYGTLSVEVKEQISLAAGATAGKIDFAYYSTSTSIATSANHDYDVYDFASSPSGTDTDPFGDAITAAKIVMVVVVNDGTVDLHAGGDGASTAWNVPFAADDDAKVIVPAKSGTQEGVLILYNPAGWSVTDTSAHIFRITNTSGSVIGSYRVLLLGQRTS